MAFYRYFDAVQAKEQRRQQRLRVHTSYDVENGEFLCPLCECLSNTVIPLLPPPRRLFNRSVALYKYCIPAHLIKEYSGYHNGVIWFD